MNSPDEAPTKIVVTLKDHKEFLSITTSDGLVEVEVRPLGRSRSRVCVTAPRRIVVKRTPRANEETK
jgi:hypothetical protein